jgi:hypothetical protein
MAESHASGDLRMVGSHAGGCGWATPESGGNSVPADDGDECASPWQQQAGASGSGVYEEEKTERRTTLLEKQINNDSTEAHQS